MVLKKTGLKLETFSESSAVIMWFMIMSVNLTTKSTPSLPLYPFSSDRLLEVASSLKLRWHFSLALFQYSVQMSDVRTRAFAFVLGKQGSQRKNCFVYKKLLVNLQMSKSVHYGEIWGYTIKVSNLGNFKMRFIYKILHTHTIFKCFL